MIGSNGMTTLLKKGKQGVNIQLYPLDVQTSTSTKWGITDYVTKKSSHHNFFKWFTTKYEQFWVTQL